MWATSAERAVDTAAAMAVGGMMTAAAAPTVAEASVWAITVLGIPLGVLAAALAGSSVSQLRQPAAPERRLAAAALATVTDGFVGGWFAMLLIGVPASAAYIGDAVRPEVVGAVCALLVQFGREHAHKYWEQLWGVIVDAVRSWFVRRGTAPPTDSGGDP